MKDRGRKLTVALTGGEPFLKKELINIIERLSTSDNVSSISIITNGTLIDKNLASLKKFPLLRKIYVSLDGVTPGVNDAIRGKDAFKKTVNNIQEFKSHSLSVVIMFTLMKENIKDAASLLSFCKSQSCDEFILERFIPLGRGAKIKNELISPFKMNELYKTIFDQCGQDYAPRKGAQFHALKVELSKGGQPELYGAECIVGKDGCALLPDGTVLPCRRFYHPLGNILKRDLNDILETSKVLNDLKRRSNLSGNCRDCGINECRGCRAMAHAVGKNYLSSDPLCRLVKNT